MTLARQLFAFFAFVLGMNVAHTSEPAFKSGGDVLEFGTVASTKADTHLRTVKTESKTVVLKEDLQYWDRQLQIDSSMSLRV